MVSSCVISVLMTSVFSVNKKEGPMSQEQGGVLYPILLCRRAKNFNLKVILMGLSFRYISNHITFI